MDIDFEPFRRLGLSEIETKAYKAALELGKSLPLHLAKKAGIKRPMLYKVLPLLLEKGLLSETMVGKRRYLVAEDPENFLERKRENIVQLEKELPQLRLIMNTAIMKPVMSIYEGVEGIKKVYMDILKTKEKEVLDFMGLERIHPVIEKYCAEYFIPERIRRNIALKVLLSGPGKSRKIHLFSDLREKREVRMVDEKNFPFPLDGFIYGDTISFAVYREDSEPAGIIIRSAEIVTAIRSLFELAWLGAQPIKNNL